MKNDEGAFRVGPDGIVAISGPMTLDSVPHLYREAQTTFNGRRPVTAVDLAGVSRADSAGLALLLEWQAQSTRRDRKLEFHNVPDDLLRLARLCAAQELLNLNGRDGAAEGDQTKCAR